MIWLATLSGLQQSLSIHFTGTCVFGSDWVTELVTVVARSAKSLIRLGSLMRAQYRWCTVHHSFIEQSAC